MRRHDVAVRWGCLALMGSMVATAVRAQPPAAAGGARLRAEVVRLRAEVEMLQLDLDLARADLVDDLKLAKGMAMMGGLMSSLQGLNGSPNGAPPGDARARDAESKTQREDAQKAEAEVASYVAERKKELARLASSIASKRLDLEDAERRYREPGPAKLGDRAIRDDMERLPRSPIGTSSRPNFEPARADVDRVPILDPIPGGPAASCCTDPPNEDEIWRKLPEPFASAADRKSSRAAVEKVGEKVDPCKVYPLAGPCQLVHCHYKVTVTLAGTAPRTEVVYIDKDHLRRCVATSHAHAAKPDAPAVVRAALTSQPATDSDLEPRMTQMEEKLDRILKALDRPGRDD